MTKRSEENSEYFRGAHFTLPRHPFSRSYGVILPSSLTRVLPRALACSARLPVSVCGTGTFSLARGFSWQPELMTFATVIFTPHHRPALRCADLPTHQPLCLDGHPSVRVTILLRHPIAHNGSRWYRNFNLLSFDYAFRPRLRSRLTLSGRAFLRNP